MAGKTGEGLIHVNVMEKLTMNAGLETLKARLLGALDAGVDGISLSAGLHASSFALMSEHPRFRDACLGIVVSSRRRSTSSCARPPERNAFPTTSSSRGRLRAAISASAWTGRTFRSPTSCATSRAGCTRTDCAFP